MSAPLPNDIRSPDLVVFTLDESTFSRELAPLAGHYPAISFVVPPIAAATLPASAR